MKHFLYKKTTIRSHFEAIKYPIYIFLVWRICILIFQFFFLPYVISTPLTQTLRQRVYEYVAYWDGAHYIHIAESGYAFPNQNFFPGWPLLIKLVTFTGASFITSSFIWTQVLSFANVLLFYRLSRKYIAKEDAHWATIFFCTFPGTMFLLVGYTENLFIFLELISFYLLERKHYVIFSLTGGAASAVRLVGSFFSTIFILLQGLSMKKKLILGIISLWGFLGYLLFLYITTHDPLFFVWAKNQWCASLHNCSFTFPLTPLIRELYNFPLLMPNRIDVENFRFVTKINPDYYNLLFPVLFLILIPRLVKRLPATYTWFVVLLILIPLTTGSTTSMTRYLLPAFPVFWVIPSLFKEKLVKILVAVTTFMMQLELLSLFQIGYFVG